MPFKRLTFLVFSTILFFSSSAQAEQTLDELLALDIYDLANIEVSTASKKHEKITEAPGIMSVITSEDIKRYGGNNLMDLLGRVTSIQNYNTAAIPENGMSIRGQSIQHYTSRILFLINGRPFRDSLVAGYSSVFFKRFPLSSVDHIEIIRGPGSVLYGSSAFSGVVNIVTRTHDLEDDPIHEFNVQYGSFGTRSEELFFARTFNDFTINISGKHDSIQGDNISYTIENGTTPSTDLTDKGYGYTGQFSYGGLTFQGFYGRTSFDNIRTTSSTINEQYQKRYMYDLGYEHDITDDWTANINLTRNRYFRPAARNNGIGFHSDDLIAEASINGALSPNSNLLFGGTVENHDGQQINTPYQTQWYSTYLQADYKPLDQLKLIIGYQLNKIKNVPRHLSPRYGAIYNFDKNWGIKLLHGEAFRSAIAAETSASLPGVLTGNSSLKPEVIETSEAQLFYNSRDLTGSVTYYHSDVKDVIGRVPAQGGGLTFDNSGENTFDGLELEGQWNYSHALSFIGNLTFQQNKRSDGVNDSTFTPNLMVKLGANYNTDNGHSLSIFDSYYGTPTPVSKLTPSVSEVNPDAESYHFVTAKMNLNVNSLLNMHNGPETTFSLYADNLLDEDIYYPEFNRQRINSYPIHSGRGIYGTLSVKF